ncbi:DUF5067 domain-containing protein [Sedimentibacter sp. zth1]|uniref:DUF5067 domain-containing protein n=1 Tax=Sedimentibacter sp. zth1 TaxID=2816908 RepID=UPI001A919E6F|nr:DUF5067 domain-containing protein [Sedimentibacter sp. zth1]QSX04801.1 DUF5067 domain-containing protein [Sedimentibacter sp. zth1]
MKKITLLSILMIMLFLLTSCFREKITLNTTLSEEDQKELDKILSETKNNTEKNADETNTEDNKEIYELGDTIQYTNFDISINEIILNENIITITFGFTNKSQNPISFDLYGYISAYQDGISLDRISIENGKEDFTFTKIQTGKTVPIYVSYELRNYTSSVEIEFSDDTTKNTVIFEDFPELNDILGICDFYDATLGDLVQVFGEDYTISDEYYDGGKIVSFKDISVFFFIDGFVEDITTAKVTAACGNDGVNILGDAVVGMSSEELSSALGCQIEPIAESNPATGQDEVYCYLPLDDNITLIIYFDSNNTSISARCLYN